MDGEEGRKRKQRRKVSFVVDTRARDGRRGDCRGEREFA